MIVIAKKKICHLCDKEYISKRKNKFICHSCLSKITGEEIIENKPKSKISNVINFNNGVYILGILGIFIIILGWSYSCFCVDYKYYDSRQHDIYMTDNYHNQLQYEQSKHHSKSNHYRERR